MVVQQADQGLNEKTQAKQQQDSTNHDDKDLNDMLQELRVLQQGMQVLAAFLVILPFTDGFARVEQAERWVYLATFVCSLASLIFLSAPAANHRLERPLKDRERFKDFSTRMIIIGLVFLSLAWILTAELVVGEVLGGTMGLVVAATVAVLIGIVWWVVPLRRKNKE